MIFIELGNCLQCYVMMDLCELCQSKQPYSEKRQSLKLIMFQASSDIIYITLLNIETHGKHFEPFYLEVQFKSVYKLEF